MRDALEAVLDRIDQDIARDRPRHPQIVCVGDYIDRGDHSAEVLLRLQDLTRDFGPDLICLMGNHERMMLDFLADPITQGRRWLRCGGMQTLASFGVRGLRETALAEDLCQAADDLRRAMARCDPHLQTWVATRPRLLRSGTVLVCHAGTDPDRSPDQQRDRDVLWGGQGPEQGLRPDGIWVVHGHFADQGAGLHPGRICVDGDVLRRGVLACAVVDPDAPPRFL